MESSDADILFITQVQLPRDTGDPSAYKPLRLEIGGQVASIPILRAFAGPDPQGALQRLAQQRTLLGVPPVLTGIYITDFMSRRGLRVTEIPVLDAGWDKVQAALERGVRLIAISTTWLPGSQGAAYVREAAARLKVMAPHVPVVAGGVGVRKGLRARALLRNGELAGLTEQELARHYLLMDADLDRHLDAVIVCEGGESTLAAMVARLRENRDFRDLPNLAIPEAGQYRFNATAGETSDLDGEIVDWSRHTARLRFFEAPLRTAMGCPFRCEFCDFMGLYEPRMRSVDSLLAELRTLAGALPAPRRVFFTDDNVAVTRQRLVSFARALADAKLGIAWRAFIRADAVDENAAALMRESGCRECLLGIESGDPGVLHNMRKKLDPEKARRAIHLLDANGIGTQCTFVVGFPGETAASLDRTAAFISSLPSGDSARALHRYYLFRFEVVPLCPAASPARRAEFGLTGSGETWAHNTMTSDEARDAMRHIFATVRGPTHMYLEHVPPDWPIAVTRRVMEARDALQKARLAGREAGGEAALLELVRKAEIDNTPRPPEGK